MYFRVAIIVTALTLSACSSWVYRYDVAQGNYLEQKSIDKLQIDMSKEQVKFILGSPVVVDAFDNNTWSYVYKLKSGRNKKFDSKRQFILKFSDDKLVSALGDFEVSENFKVPFNTPENSADKSPAVPDFKQVSEAANKNVPST
jgi:outer membrane protein assembly factor BamE